MTYKASYAYTKVLSTVLVLAAAMSAGCSGDSPLTPTSPSVMPGSSSTVTTTPSAATGSTESGAASSAVQRCGREHLAMDIYDDSGQFRPAFAGNTITLAVENVSQFACELTFTSWDRNNGSSIVLTDGQVLVDGQRYLVPAGQRVVMGPLRIPDGCYQLDVSNAGGQPIPTRADRLDAIRWHTGGACQPTAPTPPPDTRSCTTGLSVSASWADGLITLRSAASSQSASRTLRIWYRADQGAITEATAILGQAVTYPFPQSQQPHTVAVRASYVDENQATCAAETTVAIPAALPPPLTCANTTVDLSIVGESDSGTHVTGSLLMTLTGEGITGQLTVDGVASTAVNGARRPFSFERPAAGSAPIVKTATLTSRVNGEACAERTLHITLQPQVATCAGVVVGLELAPDAPTAAAISGTLISTLRGTGVTGELLLDGATSQAVDGGRMAYRYNRPPFGASPVVRTATLRGMVGGEVCGTQSVVISAPPQQATCEGSVTRLQLVPGVMSDTEVTGTLRTTVQGTGVTGTLTMFDGAMVAAADDGNVPYRVTRPPYGSAPLRLTAALATSTGGNACGTDVVTLDVPPQGPPPNCVDVKVGLDVFEDPQTPTEAVGHYLVSLRNGSGVTGRLTLGDGTTITVAHGDRVPYRYPRPAVGPEPVAVWATLTASAGPSVCGSARARVKVHPQVLQ